MAVMTSDVGGHQPLHPGAETTITTWLNDEMEMIGHQAVANQTHRSFTACQFEQFDEGSVVGGFVKDLSASVAAIEDVIAIIGLRGSGSSWHDLENRLFRLSRQS